MTAEEYLEGILAELSKVKERGGKGIFRINDKVSDSVIHALERYFKDKKEYSLELRKCAKCKGTWDVMIFFVTK